jgi:hypothetical protein
MKAGRARWLAGLKARGEPIPFGRRRGGKNRSPEQIDEARPEDEGRREWRAYRIRENAERKARRAKRRQDGAGLAEQHRRHDGFQAGQPWDNRGEPRHSGSHNLGFAAVTAEIAARYPQRDHEDGSKARPPVDMGELFDLALANMSELGGRKAYLRLLKGIEKDLIRSLSDYRKPLPPERAAWLYNRLCRWEEHFAGTDGQSSRLASLNQAFDNFEKRRRVDAIVKQLAKERSARADPRTERREQCDRPHCGCPNGVCV